MKKSLFVMLAATMLFMGCQGKKENTIKVACNLPFSGELSFYGQYLKDGISMAMNDLSDSLQLYNIDLEFDFQDNNSTSKGAVSVFNMQRMKGFDLYASCCTAQTMSIMDNVSKTGKPHFIWSFYPLELLPDTDLYRVWIDMAYEGVCFMEYIRQHNPKTVAFIYQDLSSTDEQFNKRILPFVKEQGVEVVINHPYPTDKKDFKDIVSRVSTLNPDITIIYGFQNQLMELIKGFTNYGYKKDGNILCSFDFMDVQNILAPSYLDGIVTNIPNFIICNDSDVITWKERFESRYGRKPLFTDAYAYDFVTVLFEVYKAIGKDPSISFDQAIKLVDIKGVTGPKSISETGRLSNNVVTCMYKNSTYIPM